MSVLEYIVFTDESSITKSRFPSLSAFSLPLIHYEQVKADVYKILNESGVTEFGWSNLKNAKYYFCAEKIVDWLIQNRSKYRLRIDTVVWDTHDSRHKIQGRDDMANYERMFFHLLSNSMKRRSRGSIWHVRPDERNGIDWETIRECLHHIGKKQEYRDTIFGNFLMDPFFIIQSFEQKQSDKEVLIQVADLFSGLSVFSHENYDTYCIWCRQEQNQRQMTFDFLGEEEVLKLSNSQRYRCKLLQWFNHECKKHKLGVSLDTHKHLKTFQPDNPLNFWVYKPQGEYDKAPTRETKSLGG